MTYISYDLDTDEGKVTLEVTARILECINAYGVAGSPTLYEIDDLKMEGDNGKTYTEDELPRRVMRDIEDKLIGEYR